jgi:5-formyltetrahydrofolate cyclo-ligase
MVGATETPSGAMRALMSLLPEIPDELRDQLAFRAKRELRKRLRSVRSAMPAGAIEARSRALSERLVAMEVFRRARTVALFASRADEVQCAPIEEVCRALGQRVALPVVVDESPGLVFRARWDGTREHPIETSAYGIEEPVEDAPGVSYDELDLIVVPALGVDDRGHRIGYGRGYYDRVLPRCTRAVRVVVAFEFQLLAEVPTRAGDVPCDVVVTDGRTFEARP